MYNRYIRADDGSYERVPHPEESSGGGGSDQRWEAAPMGNRRDPPDPADRQSSSFLKRILRKLNLEEIDTGDLLLLLLILFLFSEDGDEELLFALGLLLLL